MMDKEDKRIERAKVIEEIMTMPGWAILKEEWEKIKQKAFIDLTNELLDDTTLKTRQIIYNQINEWIDLPETIINEGKQVLEQERILPRVIKKNIPFLGRRR
jgi:hypothetical protein